MRMTCVNCFGVALKIGGTGGKTWAGSLCLGSDEESFLKESLTPSPNNIKEARYSNPFLLHDALLCYSAVTIS